MPKLRIKAPDGEILRVDLTPDDKPEQYNDIAKEVLDAYQSSKVETPGAIKSAALGAMSGIPGAQTAVDAITAMGDKTFEEARKETEIQKDKAWEEHPVAYGAGKTAGMVGTGLVVPTSIPGAIGVGAAAGLDAAAKPQDMIEEGLKGAAVGGALGKAGQVVGKTVIDPLIQKVAPAIGKRTVAALGDPTLETVESYLKNPERIRQALNAPQIAEKLASTTEDIGKASSQLSTLARETLKPENAPISMIDIKPIMQGAAQKYLTSGVAATAQDEAALNIIRGQYGKLLEIAKANNGVVPEVELRAIIDRLQNMANFNESGNVGTSLAQKVAGDLQFRLKNILEQSNPAYKSAMAPSAEAAGLSSKLAETFGIEKGKATDKTVRQVSNLLKEPKIEEQALAKQLKDANIMDLMDAVKASQQRGEFASSETGTALKTLMATLGFGAGKMTGVPFGGIGGAATGRFASEGIHGANVAKRILDLYLDKSAQWRNSASKAALDKYGPVLVNAAKLGGSKLAATHFVLATSEPEYQALEDELNQE